jgi:hypothetical protein
MAEEFDESTMDACLIASGQRAEHYEMAAYGTLVASAQALGPSQAAQLLEQTSTRRRRGGREADEPHGRWHQSTGGGDRRRRGTCGSLTQKPGGRTKAVVVTVALSS